MPAASPTIVSLFTAAAAESTSFRAQMMLMCGFVVLIWVLMRRTIRAKKRERRAAAEWKEHKRQIDAASEAALPLAGAPVEVLRWQGAMFDLQRELKAELETKIAVVQAMVQLADQRIATLERLQGCVASDAARDDGSPQACDDGSPAVHCESSAAIGDSPAARDGDEKSGG